MTEPSRARACHPSDQIASFLKSNATYTYSLALTGKGHVFQGFLRVSRFLSLVPPPKHRDTDKLPRIVRGTWSLGCSVGAANQGPGGHLWPRRFGPCRFGSAIRGQARGLATAHHECYVYHRLLRGWVHAFTFSPGPFAWSPWLREFCYYVQHTVSKDRSQNPRRHLLGPNFPVEGKRLWRAWLFIGLFPGFFWRL